MEPLTKETFQISAQDLKRVLAENFGVNQDEYDLTLQYRFATGKIGMPGDQLPSIALGLECVALVPIESKDTP